MTDLILPQKNFPSSIGIVICGHGSRDVEAIKEFEKLAKKIKQRLPEIPVEFGYLEFARPIIIEALDRLREKGVKKIIALPAMLFAAGHAKNDIPSVLNKYSAETGMLILYGRELGLNSLMVGAAGERIREVINSYSPYPLAETLLVVAGRGSSDPDANSNVSKITRMLVEGFGFGWGETVFSGVTFPLVESGLRYSLKLGFKRVIVFPYFLFTGVLVGRVREHTKRVAFENPNVEFLNASYLSDHKFVVDTFIERINEVLIGKNSMNCSLCKYRSNLLGFEQEVGHIQESHHHHSEACLVDCRDCGQFNCECEKEEEKLPEIHQHAHFPYPHSDHPLGPVTLCNPKDIQI